MAFLDDLVAKAQSVDKTVVLPEGQDPRVMQAAAEIAKLDVARVIVLASDEERARSAVGVDFSGLNVEIVNHLDHPEFETLAIAFQERRARRGVDMEKARETMKNRLYFGNMLVKTGHADGLVAGSISSTGDMLRAAFHCIGTAPGIRVASSTFMMELATPTAAGETVLAYSDCAVNPNPTAEQLVDIAIASAGTRHALVGGQQKIAMLSFSTKGSARHELVEKMQLATELTQAKIAEMGLPYLIDGELQLDAALVPAIGAKKAPNSDVAGYANVLIFPDLQAGNISYKMTERLAGANAFGPVVQGLAKPVNDLSRGCSFDDIVAVAAITICQSVG